MNKIEALEKIAFLISRPILSVIGTFVEHCQIHAMYLEFDVFQINLKQMLTKLFIRRYNTESGIVCTRQQPNLYHKMISLMILFSLQSTFIRLLFQLILFLLLSRVQRNLPMMIIHRRYPR